MRFTEVPTPAGTVGFAVIPVEARLSDAGGLTNAALWTAGSFKFRAVFIVNRDRIRGWESMTVYGRAIETPPFFDERSGDVLGVYSTEASKLESAGEAVLTGLVERWLSDLMTHWMHRPGAVPAETKLRNEGINLSTTGSVAQP